MAKKAKKEKKAKKAKKGKVDAKARVAATGEPESGEALFALIWELTQTFFRLRAAGQQDGAVTSWGAGSWGLLHGLALDGPQTVPQIARKRPVSRQHIQKLADELAADGLVAFVDNPAHKRSRLVTLTRRGEAHYADLTARIKTLCGSLAEGMDPGEIDTAARVLRDVKTRIGESAPSA